MIPKNTLSLNNQILFFLFTLSLHIHLVAKISPATICAHIAVTPAFVDKPFARPTKNP